MAVKARLSERMKKHVLTPLRWKDWERFCGFRGQQRKQMSEFLTGTPGTVRHGQSKEASILRSHHEETRQLPGEEIMPGTMPGACRWGRPRTPRSTSRRGQDSPQKSQLEWQKTGINEESTFMVWPTLGLRMAKERNSFWFRAVD